MVFCGYCIKGPKSSWFSCELGQVQICKLSSNNFFCEPRRANANVYFHFVLQEKYLSEHNYDEPIDVDSTLKLLNFGDDYSKFIDSMSDEFSDLDQGTVKPQRTKRKIRRQSTVNNFILIDACFTQFKVTKARGCDSKMRNSNQF